jgi:hypothetical protein
MEIYYKEIIEHREAIWDSFPYTHIALIYHCKHCGCDWDSEYFSEFGNTSQSAPKRHYWG